MLSIIYSSTAERPFDDEQLTELLTVSRDNNARDGLTGMLLYRDGRFLQVLEGPTDALRSRMSTIAADSRHHDVMILLEEMTSTRRFPEWTMGFETLADADLEDSPGFRDSFEDLDDAEDADDTIRVLRPLVKWFQLRSDRGA